jgi:hypothetical protein
MHVSEPTPPATDRRPATFLAGGIAAALLALVPAAIAGPPYLELSGLSAWIVVFAVALFAALFACPFAIHQRLDDALEGDARWERALLWWGAASITVLAAGLLLGLPSGFSSTSLAGSIGLVAVVEAVLVLGTLVLWLLAN